MSTRTSRRNLVREVKRTIRSSGAASLIANTDRTGDVSAYFRKTPANASRRKRLAAHVRRFRFHPATGGKFAGPAYERFKRDHAKRHGL